MIPIQVAHVTTAMQHRVDLQVPSGTTLHEAVTRSGLVEDQTVSMQFGIFGKICSPETLLQAGDRIEIYRPLLVDPKTSRRLRASRRT